MPLFRYIEDPSQINFEDDIVLILKSFMKKSGKVSSLLWEIFPYLDRILAKNGTQFGNLFDAINLYIIYGKDELISTPSYLDTLVEMAY